MLEDMLKDVETITNSNTTYPVTYPGTGTKMGEGTIYDGTVYIDPLTNEPKEFKYGKTITMPLENDYKPVPKYTKLLFVEDGSINDLEKVTSTLDPIGIKVIIYRQGAAKPELVDIDK